MVTCSPLATMAPRPRCGRPRSADVFGFVLHTTGSSIVDQAREHGVDPLEHVVDYYTDPASFFPHYVIGWDGKIIQIADELERAQHVGFDERQHYLDGDWVKYVGPTTLASWRAAWPGVPSPAALFPGPSPNNVYVGAEMLPLEETVPEAARPFPRARFSFAQHQAAVILARDVADRHGFPGSWSQGARLLGHEDLNPMKRADAGGGWDPGAMRPRPQLALWWVRELCGGVDPGAIAATAPLR